MEFAGAISSACTLSYHIYTRCSASRGEFRRLSDQALSIHDILKTIQSVCRQGTLTEEQQKSLKARIIPLRDLLENVDARLKTYSSLGTKSPKLTDKIAWAAAGGASEVRTDLNSQLQGLIAWNTSVLLQQHGEARTEPGLLVSGSETDIEAQIQPPQSPISPSANSVQATSQSVKVSEKGPSGSRFLVDGVQLIIFTFLTLFGTGIMLTIMCFYLINIILFPLVAIPSCCMRTKIGWKDCNTFWKDLFRHVWGFTSGLWD